MFTKCEHCEAIFRVNMREVTVAKGKLRCGECHQVFSANASLSTTMPEPYSEEVVEYLDVPSESENTFTRDSRLKKRFSKKRKDDPNSRFTESQNGKERLIKGVESPKQIPKIGLILIALLLMATLVGQVLYQNKHLFLGSLYQPEKIQMLNYNVFAHPIEKGILLISANIINNAQHEQPYPILELRLIDSQSNVVGLRRFKPYEYLEKYSPEVKLKVKEESSLKLKIEDPGSRATRFQFNFL